MTTSEYDIVRDEQERSNLARAVADLETAIAVASPGTRRILEGTLDNAKKRIDTLDKKIEDAKVERAADVQAQLTASAVLAARETKLSASERETYRGFLEEPYFTKHDFGHLQQFYAHTWDRLSEGGKDEMSHRVWEGVRHDEYRFSDLPNDLQEKESKRLYGKLTTSAIDQGALTNIPEADRTDFIRAHEAGNAKEAGQILNRDSFRRNVALETSRKTASASKAADDDQILSRNTAANSEVKAALSGETMDRKLESVNLNGLVLEDSDLTPSTASIPDVSIQRVNGRS